MRTKISSSTPTASDSPADGNEIELARSSSEKRRYGPIGTLVSKLL